jgi:aldose 1-epimerase
MNKETPIASEDLKIYTLTNKKGTRLKILNLGATIFGLLIKDKNGKEVNVVVGPKNPEAYISTDYQNENRCFGASIGRYAGRISKGEFELEGKKYSLFQKNGVHLHGGLRGFQHKIWSLETENKKMNPSITLGCFSEDLEEGYPGNLKIEVKYTLSEDDEMQIEYSATTNHKTPVNLTNHTYFNLNGKGSVSDHQLCINADNILEVDEKLIPTGKLLPLKDHPKNFSEVKEIQQLEVDDTFVLEKDKKNAAIVYSSQTGIQMQVITNQPAVVVYIPDHLPELWEYQINISSEFPSICLETQNYPDAPNHKNFPSAILHPGETYLNKSQFQFRIKKE